MTNLELLQSNRHSCPYALVVPPISAKTFCKDGCSVDCKKIMIEELERTKGGKEFLNSIAKW